MKWNGGEQGKKITFEYGNGELVTYDDIAECGAATSVQAAVAIIEEFTYKNDKEVLARLRAPGLTDDERGEIERGFGWRIREQGVGWKAGHGSGAIPLTREHHIIDRFREITGIGRAGEGDLLTALADAKRAGLLDYAESDQAVKSSKRRPAGYCIGANQVVDDDPFGMQ
jgi:hypothetical protein